MKDGDDDADGDDDDDGLCRGAPINVNVQIF